MSRDYHSFDELFTTALRSAGPPHRVHGECHSPSGQRCTLCAASSVDYDREAAVKTAALKEFWRGIGEPSTLDPLIRSPLGRGYRTVTKRKVFHGRDGVRIGLIDPSERGPRPFDAVRCAIEPNDHAKIYAVVREELGTRRMEPLAEHLSYVIIKGTHTRWTVLFNVRDVGPGLIKAANDLSKRLSRVCPTIVATFVYQEQSGGRFYMDTGRARKRHTLRKLFGTSDISLVVAGKKFIYSPLSFSQVNHSILELLVDTVSALLLPSTDRTLYDLYCGFGMFTLCLADRFHSVTGVELSPDSLEEARENARRLNVRNVRFVRQDITGGSLVKVLHGIRSADAVLLDPPRGGASEGVIECVAGHLPARALHIFCNIDLIPDDVERWKKGGYTLTKAVPLDMFPGTSNVELLLLFERVV